MVAILVPISRLLSVRNCVTVLFPNLPLQDPSLPLRYEYYNIYIERGLNYPANIILGGYAIYFSTNPTDIATLNVNLSGGVAMADDLAAILKYWYPEFEVITDVSGDPFLITVRRIYCGDTPLRFSTTGMPPDLTVEYFLSPEYAQGGVFGKMNFTLWHGKDLTVQACTTSNSINGTAWAKPYQTCNCVVPFEGEAIINVSDVLRAFVSAGFPNIAGAYNSNIATVRPERTELFFLRGIYESNSNYFNDTLQPGINEDPFFGGGQTVIAQVYYGLLQPEYVQTIGRTQFERHVGDDAFPLNLNFNNLSTCRDQLRWVYWYLDIPLNSCFDLILVVFHGGAVTEITIKYNYDMFSVGGAPLNENNVGMVFEFDAGLDQLTDTLVGNGIDPNMVTSIIFQISVKGEGCGDILYNTHPLIYDYSNDCCCDNYEFIFLSSIGSWESILLEKRDIEQYGILTTEINDYVCCHTNTNNIDNNDSKTDWTNETLTTARTLTRAYNATLKPADYYGGTPSDARYYDGAAYIREFLTSKEVYLVIRTTGFATAQLHSERLFYRAVISGELPDVDGNTLPITFKLWQNQSL